MPQQRPRVPAGCAATVGCPPPGALPPAPALSETLILASLSPRSGRGTRCRLRPCPRGSIPASWAELKIVSWGGHASPRAGSAGPGWGPCVRPCRQLCWALQGLGGHRVPLAAWRGGTRDVWGQGDVTPPRDPQPKPTSLNLGHQHPALGTLGGSGDPGGGFGDPGDLGGAVHPLSPRCPSSAAAAPSHGFPGNLGGSGPGLVFGGALQSWVDGAGTVTSPDVPPAPLSSVPLWGQRARCGCSPGRWAVPPSRWVSPGPCWRPWGHPVARWGRLTPRRCPRGPQAPSPPLGRPRCPRSPEPGGNAAAWPRPPRSSLAEQLGRASTAPLMAAGWPRPLELIGSRPGRSFPAPLRGRRRLFPQWGGRGQGVPAPAGSELCAGGQRGRGAVLLPAGTPQCRERRRGADSGGAAALWAQTPPCPPGSPAGRMGRVALRWQGTHGTPPACFPCRSILPLAARVPQVPRSLLPPAHRFGKYRWVSVQAAAGKRGQREAGNAAAVRGCSRAHAAPACACAPQVWGPPASPPSWMGSAVTRVPASHRGPHA